MDVFACLADAVKSAPIPLLGLFVGATAIGVCVLFYVIIFIVAPSPRPPLSSEKTYICIEREGKRSADKQLPCWVEQWRAQKDVSNKSGRLSASSIEIESPEVFMSLVIPAYNEEARLEAMISEAVQYLEQHYGTNPSPKRHAKANGSAHKTNPDHDPTTGWEILLVSDGSTDRTIETALSYARSISPSSASNIRIISLAKNRGKGGAVTHGLRHVRGAYAIFADADGASKFSDLGKLVEACRAVEDASGRAVAVGSRAHLVGSDAVVKRSWLRNFLMHSFHLLLRLLTPPATGRIRDTQCGFKLFSRPALPCIVPFMHSEGWIFDVEMLMLAESAGIPVAEVPIGWKEVTGSKLNVLWDSLGMAWGLAILRAAWGIGIYRRD